MEEIEPTGWPWMLVLALLASFVLTMILRGVACVLLVSDLVRRGEGRSDE